ncbi:hypothetical protein [Spirillospora sp. NPDC047279]|uniref:hypothetical protein n=1 Tax=Spirillospora sp. NPDC047279 TaxID=3155478 RepID=UPI0033D4C9FC
MLRVIAHPAATAAVRIERHGHDLLVSALSTHKSIDEAINMTTNMTPEKAHH